MDGHVVSAALTLVGALAAGAVLMVVLQRWAGSAARSAPPAEPAPVDAVRHRDGNVLADDGNLPWARYGARGRGRARVHLAQSLLVAVVDPHGVQLRHGRQPVADLVARGATRGFQSQGDDGAP